MIKVSVVSTKDIWKYIIKNRRYSCCFIYNIKNIQLFKKEF